MFGEFENVFVPTYDINIGFYGLLVEVSNSYFSREKIYSSITSAYEIQWMNFEKKQKCSE